MKQDLCKGPEPSESMVFMKVEEVEMGVRGVIKNWSARKGLYTQGQKELRLHLEKMKF